MKSAQKNNELKYSIRLIITKFILHAFSCYLILFYWLGTFFELAILKNTVYYIKTHLSITRSLEVQIMWSFEYMLHLFYAANSIFRLNKFVQ